MNWVAPIKDEKTFKDFEERLRMMGSKYYIMFEIGVGTGLQLQDVLKLLQQKYNILAVTQLDPSQFEAFAADLRALGAEI